MAEMKVSIHASSASLGPTIAATDPEDRRAVLGDDLLERLRIGHASPVSRTVMLTRPGGRSSQPGAVPSSTFGTP